MISNNSLTKEWIGKISVSNRNADKILIEKVIRALLLLEGLSKYNIDFVFKGGTALMLLLNNAKRLSIDIDIIIPERPENLEKTLNLIAKEQLFVKVTRHERNTNSEIRKEHFKFFYNPIHRTHSADEYILLDIVFESINYQKINKLPILSNFILNEGETMTVSIPSIEDILADKLTAFAPNTTGIPYFKNGKSMSMEIIKQLYDIGNLTDMANDIETVKKTFSKFVNAESEYKNVERITIKDVLDDIFQTSLTIVSRGAVGKGNFTELQRGIGRVSNFIFSESFHIEKAIVFASKAAYMATLINNNSEIIEKYDNPSKMEDWFIQNPIWTKINRFKRLNPEAFFFWYKINTLL